MTPEPAADDGGGLVRVRLDLAYDGAGFAGWARQPDQRTVQGCLEQALSTVLQADVSVTCAGRTDAGVHARGQVAHTDLAGEQLGAARGRSERDGLEALVRRVNSVLPEDVRVRGCRRAPAGFDARFAAVWRRYAYRVRDDVCGLDPLRRGHELWWPRPLDVDAMNQAAAALVGEHDFVAYCRRRPGASTLRHLQLLQWQRDEPGLAVLHARADGFCHQMVRSLAGALIEVGDGRRPAAWPEELLGATERPAGVPVAPARGLTLEAVGYPPDEQLADRVVQTRRRRGAPPP